MNCDPVTGKTTNRVNLFKQLSTASSGSSGSDKLCLTDSIPMGIFTGEKKIETSCNRNYREENDKLRVEIERLKNEVKVLYDAVETSIDKQGNGRDIASGDFPSGLEGMDDCDMGVAKMVTNRSSMRTDDKGNPIPSSAVGKCSMISLKIVVTHTRTHAHTSPPHTHTHTPTHSPTHAHTHRST